MPGSAPLPGEPPNNDTENQKVLRDMTGRGVLSQGASSLDGKGGHTKKRSNVPSAASLYGAAAHTEARGYWSGGISSEIFRFKS